MKRAKTNKKIFTIFSAILGVVFAFLTGVTYCASSLNLRYETHPKQTSAYMGNQQYYVINDTASTLSPVVFGPGAHNFEIAIQYSFAYDFDLRVKYSMLWSNGASTDNVILNFADRDNVIYDEEFIYVTKTIPAGSGKVTLITGCEFIDVNDVATYRGARLTISVGDSDVSIYKSQTSYSESNPLYKTAKTTKSTQSVASQAWLQCKKNEVSSESTDAYMMLYNYRRDYKHGVPFPGAKTAYKKSIVETENVKSVSNAIWGGGNSYYAGTGLYVIAGSTPLKLEIQVGGIWRTSGATELATENNIQYNYTDNWTFSKYSTNAYTQDTGLWEIRTFNYTIPAKTADKPAYYIDILDSIEITSARGSATILSSDYHLVTNHIIINPSSANAKTYTYDKTEDDLIRYDLIKTNEKITTTKPDYTSDLISVVNTTKYEKGLYDTFNKGRSEQQFFDGNITLINNTSVTQSVTVSYVLHYHISNAKTKLYDANKDRAVDLIDRTTIDPKPYSPQDAFDSDEDNLAVNTLYYTYKSTSDALAEVSSASVKIAPYSSVNVLSRYAVGSGLTEELIHPTNGFDDSKTTDVVEYYDAWTYLVPTLSTPVEVSTDSSSDTTSVKTDLLLETTQTAVQTVLSLKNNTNQAVTGLEISKLSVREYKKTIGSVEENEPNDWKSSYWKYCDASGNTAEQTFVANTYKLVTETYTDTGVTIYYNNSGGFFLQNNKIVDTKDEKTVLLPGESIMIATIATTEPLIVSATCTASNVTTPNDIEIINDGTSNAHLVNYTENSYLIRFSVVVTGAHIETFSNKSYYIGVLRPGQILNISMSSNATVEKIDLQGRDYDEQILKGEGWTERAVINRYNDYFNCK